MKEPILVVHDMSKKFGSVQALNNVSAEFFPGEVHAILGENGAGKSTLVGVLSGFVTPDAGTVNMRGKPVPLGKSSDMKARGIGMVHQHFMLVPEFTVSENLALSEIGNLKGGLSERDLTRSAVAWAHRLAWEIDLTAQTRSLPVGVQQRIEILKALASEGDLLILDEPTAVLAPHEVDELFQVLRQLTTAGKAVILIAHKIAEIMAIANRVTVLRRGIRVASCLLAETNAIELSHWMVGDVPEAAARPDATMGSAQVVAQNLTVLGDRGESSVRSITFEVKAGEIFGLGGVDGNGQLELAEAVAGVRSFQGVLEVSESPAYIPQDRQRDGIAPDLSVQENLTLGALTSPTLSTRLWLRGKRIDLWAKDLIQKYEIKVSTSQDPVGKLSGGNQQKVIVARTLANRPKVIVAMNPTRGLDIRATAFVHEQLRDARARGAAVLLISTDLAELTDLSDRHAFLSRGALAQDIGGDF